MVLCASWRYQAAVYKTVLSCVHSCDRERRARQRLWESVFWISQTAIRVLSCSMSKRTARASAPEIITISTLTNTLLSSSWAKVIAKGIHTQFCTERRILRNSCEAPKMRVFQKNQNGAQDGAQDRFYKRNTLSQKALKQRIYAVCAGRSDGTWIERFDYCVLAYLP